MPLAGWNYKKKTRVTKVKKPVEMTNSCFSLASGSDQNYSFAPVLTDFQ
jgi:hypothetical protein